MMSQKWYLWRISKMVNRLEKKRAASANSLPQNFILDMNNKFHNSFKLVEIWMLGSQWLW